MHRKWLTAALLAVACVALFVLIRTTKTGLIPNEDQGTVFVNVSTAPGSNLSETLRIMDEVEKRVATLPQVERYAKVTGYGMVSGNGPSTGMMIVKLKHWDERTAMKDKLNAVIGQLYGRMADIKAAKIMIFAPPMIMGYGNTNSVELYVQDKTGGSTEKLQAETTRLIDALSKRPEVSMAFTSFDTRYPQYRVEVDAVQCKKNGVSPAEVLSTLSGYMGGNYASNLNLFPNSIVSWCRPLPNIVWMKIIGQHFCAYFIGRDVPYRPVSQIDQSLWCGIAGAFQYVSRHSCQCDACRWLQFGAGNSSDS